MTMSPRLMRALLVLLAAFAVTANLDRPTPVPGGEDGERTLIALSAPADDDPSTCSCPKDTQNSECDEGVCAMAFVAIAPPSALAWRDARRSRLSDAGSGRTRAPDPTPPKTFA